MSDDAAYLTRLPEHPELREIALAIEGARVSAEILDSSFRTVYFSTEWARVVGLSEEDIRRVYGTSQIVRTLEEDNDILNLPPESSVAWWITGTPAPLQLKDFGCRSIAQSGGDVPAWMIWMTLNPWRR